ncbi:unnamed protein product [Coccothraustes coccothraustes]
MQALTHAKDANVELSGAKRLSRAAFGRSRALESTATGTMLLARRSRLFASGSRRARPLLRREERSRTTVAFSAQPSNSSRTRSFSRMAAGSGNSLRSPYRLLFGVSCRLHVPEQLFQYVPYRETVPAQQTYPNIN